MRFLNFVLIILLIFSCSKKDDTPNQKEVVYSKEHAKIINQVTDGIISGNDPILIHFNSNINTKKISSNLETNKLISFEPNTVGRLFWRDKQTLEFIPDEKLEKNKQYIGKLNLNQLLPDEKIDKPEFPIMFYVRGNRVTSFNADYSVLSAENPKKVRLQGQLTFIDSVSFDDVKSKISITGDENISIHWEEKTPGKSFEFKSSTMERGTESIKFEARIAKEAFDLKKDVEKTILVNSLNKLQVSSVFKQGAGSNSKIIVSFSDPLKSDKDWSSYFSVEPEVPSKIITNKKQLIITGPFISGETYSISLKKGIESKWGTKLESNHNSDIVFRDEKPRIQFANDGIYLPSANKKQIAVRAINVKRFYLVVERIYENELTNYFRYRDFTGNKKYRDGQHYKTYNLRSIGEHVKSQWVEVNPPKNEWVNVQIDLKDLLDELTNGLYIVRTVFNINDIMYIEPEGDIYDNSNSPLSHNYYRNFGKAEKYLILTDMALSVKKSKSEVTVYASDVISTDPIPGAKILLQNEKGTTLRSKKTNSKGYVTFDIEEDYYRNRVVFVAGEKNNTSTFLKLNNSKWDKTLFKTSGQRLNSNSVNTFLYTDRGVYRPGDTINLSGIARNELNTFPSNHPIRLDLVNPNGQMVLDQVSKNAKDGMFNFTFSTEPDAPTGTWIATVYTGSRSFRKAIKVETIVPDKFLVKHTFDVDDFIETKTTSITLNAKYLFGTPAKEMNYTTEAKMIAGPNRFREYSNFVFHDQTKEFEQTETVISESKLDESGNSTFTHHFDDYSDAPGRLTWELTSKVFEPGGRFTKQLTRKIYNPYKSYVGIQKPASYWLESGNPVNLNLVLLDTKGQEVPNKRLTYKIYVNKEIWWYDYGSRSEYKKRYKENTKTIEIDRGELITQEGTSSLEFIPTSNGKVLVEVTDPESGHTSAIFLQAYSWGDSELNAQAYHVSIKMDKAKYTVGDVAQFSVPTPAQGKIIYSVEKNDRVLSFDTKEVSGDAETVIDVKITDDMSPNVYLVMSIVQPHAQTKNDRPIRMLGITPVYVFDPESKIEIDFKNIDKLEPNEPFNITLNTGKKAQVTLAVIDEGLLSLTNFKTPDPWKYYNKKQMLEIDTYDSYFHFIGVDWGDTFKSVKIGGDYSDETSKDSAKKRKLMRFKPTALFKGPLETDANGHLSVDFKMPEYIGAVRVMAVAANGKMYGSNHMRVPVKTDLMILPTLPRELGPKDKFTLPITVFSMKESPQNVDVSISVEGPLVIKGEKVKNLSFSKSGDKNISFDLETDAAIGQAKVTIVAKSKSKTVKSVTDIEVKVSNPKIYQFTDKILKAGQPAKFVSSVDGIKGTNTKKISISRVPKFNISHRLDYLIRYPYGCIEQTTSSIFPQLFLSSVLSDKSRQPEIDRHINSGIARLRTFQTSSGSFSYWPGQTETNDWGTNYAGHFLIEAKNKGYSVSEGFFQNWLSYQKRKARTETSKKLDQLYRLYLLALAGEPELSAMNQIKESDITTLAATPRWLLASAYKLAGYEDVAKELVKGASTKVSEYTEFSGTYGSHIRDRAMILEACLLLKKTDEAMLVYKDLVEELSTQKWYSTQTLAYALLSVGKFIEERSQESSEMSGIITINSEKIPFKTKEMIYSHEYHSDEKDNIDVTLNSNQSVYAFYEWSGVPLREGVKPIQNHFNLEVKWYNEDGELIDPTVIEQGKSFYAHYRVKMNERKDIDEVVLDQIIPSGWEIENLRLNDEALPSWMSGFNLDQEEYLDIRDGRIMWFFDYKSYRERNYDFVVKLNAITAGTFFLAPTKVEAMYNKKYQAIIAGKEVTVTKRK